jgi:hypothetical protein
MSSQWVILIKSDPFLLMLLRRYIQILFYYPTKHNKGPSQRKTVRAEIYFYKGRKSQMASIAIKEAVMQK